jgi:hypothetical protein
MRDMGNDNPPFKEFKGQRDAALDAVEKAWKFPYPAAAAEAVTKAYSAAGKKSGDARKKNSLTAPHAEEALELVIKTRRLKPKTSSTTSIGKDMADKFGGSSKTWERFITDAEDEGLVTKQLKT